MENLKTMEVQLYRYEPDWEAAHDDEGYPNNVRRLNLRKFKIISRTEKSWTIEDKYAKNKLGYHIVRKDARKKFAYPTKEEAMENFIARTMRHMGILKHKDYMLQGFMKTAEKMKIK
jgi:hypothetical protein